MLNFLKKTKPASRTVTELEDELSRLNDVLSEKDEVIQDYVRKLISYNAIIAELRDQRNHYRSLYANLQNAVMDLHDTALHPDGVLESRYSNSPTDNEGR